MWPDIHRLVGNTDDVNVIAADNIKDDMTTFGKTPVSAMNIVPFTTR